MHNVPYGLYIWLGGLILLIVVVLYVVPWWQARRTRSAPPSAPPEPNGDPGTDEQARPSRPGT
jgi:hypothetical protein